MTSRISSGSGGPEHRRATRFIQRRSRDEGIEQGAWKVYRVGGWPSPREVSAITGISESVVDRQKYLLRPARLAWVERHGPHPQWGDGSQEIEGDPRDARIAALERQVGRLTIKLDYAVSLIKRLRRVIPRLRREAREACSKRDEFIASIRPPVVQQMAERNEQMAGQGDPGPVAKLKLKAGSGRA